MNSDQILQNASDLGLHCLPITILGVSRLKCVIMFLSNPYTQLNIGMSGCTIKQSLQCNKHLKYKKHSIPENVVTALAIAVVFHQCSKFTFACIAGLFP